MPVRCTGEAKRSQGVPIDDIEEGLVRRAREGDADAYGALARRHRRAALRVADRLVIALRHFEQLSQREMVEALACPPGTVKSRLSRAMARLRAELDRTGVPDGEGGELT